MLRRLFQLVLRACFRSRAYGAESLQTPGPRSRVWFRSGSCRRPRYPTLPAFPRQAHPAVRVARRELTRPRLKSYHQRVNSAASRRVTQIAGCRVQPVGTWLCRAWNSWLILAVFAWQFLFVPVHLLMACHDAHPDPTFAADEPFMDPHCADAHGSGHVPHCVSDHSSPFSPHIQPVPQTWDFAPADSSSVIAKVGTFLVSVVREQNCPPDRPPPGLALPRAPPLA